MRKPLFLLFIFSFVSSMYASAQGSLVFCENVEADGEISNPFESLIVSPEGQMIQLVYKSEKGAIGTPQLKLEIAKLKDHAFVKTDLRSVFTDPTKEVVAIPFHVHSEGDYRFRLSNQNGLLLAEEILSVSLEMTESGNSRENKEQSNLPKLSDHADLQFSDDGPEGINTEFSFRNTRGRIQLILEPFDEKDPKRILDIWQSEGGQYKKFIRSEEAVFTRKDDSGVYTLSFPSMQDYKVDVHLNDNTLQTSGFVSFK